MPPPAASCLRDSQIHLEIEDVEWEDVSRFSPGVPRSVARLLAILVRWNILDGGTTLTLILSNLIHRSPFLFIL